jgi:hypothetical protein
MMTVCPFVSSAPYIMGCENGYIVLLTTSVKCETRCAAWKDDHCIRLSEGKCECKSAGDDTNATKTN